MLRASDPYLTFVKVGHMSRECPTGGSAGGRGGFGGNSGSGGQECYKVCQLLN